MQLFERCQCDMKTNVLKAPRPIQLILQDKWCFEMSQCHISITFQKSKLIQAISERMVQISAKDTLFSSTVISQIFPNNNTKYN